MSAYERYLQSVYGTKGVQDAQGQRLEEKKKAEKDALNALMFKGSDLALNLRNKAVADRATGTDVYYTREGVPIPLARGIETTPDNILETIRRGAWLKESDFTPIDYSGIDSLMTPEDYASYKKTIMTPADKERSAMLQDYWQGVNPPRTPVTDSIPGDAISDAIPDAVPDVGLDMGLTEGAPSTVGMSPSVGTALSGLNLLQSVKDMQGTGSLPRTSGQAVAMDKAKENAFIDALLAAGTFTPAAPITGALGLGKSLLNILGVV